jgi:hypothetical protein
MSATRKIQPVLVKRYAQSRLYDTANRRYVGLLWTVGFFGLLAAAHAQSPSSSTAGTPFYGTYAFVSAANCE